MLIFKPEKGEKKDDFLKRCMSNPTMIEEYPDEELRNTICLSQWRDNELKDNGINIERRNYLVKELRTDDIDGIKSIIGYSAVFNILSDDLGGFREKVEPGAFKNTIKKSDIRALWNHDTNLVLGRKKSKTLRLKEDDHGLEIKIIPPDTQWARDHTVTIDRGDVDQMSFGFVTINDKWEKQDGLHVRTLLEVELFDVSPVTYPAYPDTEVALRSLNFFRTKNAPLSDRTNTPDPLVRNALLAEEDKLYRKIHLGGKK